MTTTDTKPSPMMAQWHECKEQAKEAVLLFRLGDFYEAFYDDALLLSKELDLTLTKRQQVPMSGIPHHASESYIDKLVSKGYRVAIAEQVEDPRQTKGLVKREITRIITPGTVISVSLLQEKTNNYIAALTQVGQRIGLAFLDITTAEFRVIELDDMPAIQNELYRLHPKELIISTKFQERHPEMIKNLHASLDCMIDIIEEWRFDHKLTYTFLTQAFRVHSLDGFGLKGMVAAINASGALLAYVKETLLQPIDSLQSILPYSCDAYMNLDQATMRNLEITEPLNGSKKKTLLDILDYTQTPMGGRLLKGWLKQPLMEISEIHARQEAIAELISHPSLLEKLTLELSMIKDLERLTTRITSGYASPRDLVALKSSLEPIKNVKAILNSLPTALLERQNTLLKELVDVTNLIGKALIDEPPFRLGDGTTFREGYDERLDEFRTLASDSKNWMSSYQQDIREKTGIKSLKVGYTKVSGFYIEVSRGQCDKVPDIFQKRQTLTNAERFMTPELKEYEEKILSAEEKMVAIEAALFQTLRQTISTYSEAILTNARAIAIIDCLASFAAAAQLNHYIKPIVDTGGVIDIVEGRHPVIESAHLQEKFTPNDTQLDSDQRLLLITGPNMAGKSTYIRQVALIVIMAQIGSYVPAKSARIGIVDKVFTRIGASDDLSRGQSTFMVEMAETANILHHATSNSLVILDEIGRGTSTYDGISLAWSIAEYLLTTEGKKAKTLFATHYWELTKLEEKVIGAVNYNVAVHESGDQIIFLRKIVKGGTDKSYGIHVARLAGLPTAVLIRAKEILEHLEENANQKNAFEVARPKRLNASKRPVTPSGVQLSLLQEL